MDQRTDLIVRLLEIDIEIHQLGNRISQLSRERIALTASVDFVEKTVKPVSVGDVVRSGENRYIVESVEPQGNGRTPVVVGRRFKKVSEKPSKITARLTKYEVVN